MVSSFILNCHARFRERHEALCWDKYLITQKGYSSRLKGICQGNGQFALKPDRQHKLKPGDKGLGSSRQNVGRSIKRIQLSVVMQAKAKRLS